MLCAVHSLCDGVRDIVRTFTEAERERFHNLLKLAAESPFEGERTNALDAARRLAAKHGLTMEEAARADGFAQRPPPPREEEPFTAGRFAAAVHLMDYHLYLDKKRREEALAEARARGLDREEGTGPGTASP